MILSGDISRTPWSEEFPLGVGNITFHLHLITFRPYCSIKYMQYIFDDI